MAPVLTLPHPAPRKHPHPFGQKVSERLERFYFRPSLIEPLSGGPGQRETRSERREALVDVAKALLRRTDFVTGVIWCLDRDGGVSGVERSRIAVESGLSVSRVDRAISDLHAARFLDSRKRCESLHGRRFRGHASRREWTAFFWAAVGLTVELDQLRRHIHKDARRMAKSEQINAELRGRAGRRRHQNMSRKARIVSTVRAGIPAAPRVDSDPDFVRQYSERCAAIRSEQPDLPGPEVRRQADEFVRARWRGPPQPPFVPST